MPIENPGLGHQDCDDPTISRTTVRRHPAVFVDYNLVQALVMTCVLTGFAAGALARQLPPRHFPARAIGENLPLPVVLAPTYIVSPETRCRVVLPRRFRAVGLVVIDVTGGVARSQNLGAAVDLTADRATADTARTLQAVVNSNINVQRQCRQYRAHVPRSCAASPDRSIADLRQHHGLAKRRAILWLVKDIATVTVGEKPRLGIAGPRSGRRLVLRHRADAARPSKARPPSRGVEALVNSLNNSSILRRRAASSALDRQRT